MWPRIEGHSAPPLPPAAIDRIVKQIFRRPSPVLFGGQQNGPLSAHDRYSESNSTNQRGYLVAGGVSILSAYLRSEEHTSELQSLMRNSYAVFCLKKKKQIDNNNNHTTHVH